MMEIYKMSDDPEAWVRAAQVALAAGDTKFAHACLVESWRAVAARNTARKDP